MTNETQTTEKKGASDELRQGQGKTLRGTVVSTKMQDTVVVRVQQYKKHPKYKKYIKRSKKYLAHDPNTTLSEGDTATIVECSPISKNKHFRVVTD